MRQFKMKDESLKYKQGLTLNLTEERFLARLLRINWQYPIIADTALHRKEKSKRDSAYVIAMKKKGNYLLLFQRVEDDRMRLAK